MIIELLTGAPLDGRWHRIDDPGEDLPAGTTVTAVELEWADTAAAAGVVEFTADGRRMRVVDPSRVRQLTTAVTA